MVLKYFEISQNDLDYIRNNTNNLVPNPLWIEIGNKYGFYSDTIKPIEGKDQRFFMAEQLST